MVIVSCTLSVQDSFHYSLSQQYCVVIEKRGACLTSPARLGSSVYTYTGHTRPNICCLLAMHVGTCWHRNLKTFFKLVCKIGAFLHSTLVRNCNAVPEEYVCVIRQITEFFVSVNSVNMCKPASVCVCVCVCVCGNSSGGQQWLELSYWVFE